MHPRMIWSIYLKDTRDAIRDARVLVAILVPLGLGIFYHYVLDDNVANIAGLETTAVYAASESTDLPAALAEVVSGTFTLDTTAVASADEVRRQVGAESADLGLIIPAGFDAAVRAGAQPEVVVVVAEEAGADVYFVVASLGSALREVSGREPPATVRVEQTGVSSRAGTVFLEVGFRSYSVLVTIVFLVVMISMLAVPVILAEEAEKKTLSALTMIASYADVVIGKALVGVTYIVVAIGLQVSITQLWPKNWLLFGAALGTLSVSLIGFGLLLGSIFRSANQLNTWSGFLLTPILAPAFMVGVPAPAAVETALRLFPTSQATMVAVNGLTGRSLFANPGFGLIVIAIYGVGAYAVLLRHLNRNRQ